MARVQSANPDEPPYQLVIAGWNKHGLPVLIDNDGNLRLVNDGETITDLVYD